MSPSWNRFLARLWPQPEGAIGLGFSGDRVIGVRAEKQDTGFCVTHLAEERLPFLPFRSPPRPGEDALLSEAFQRVANAIPQGHWPLQIALPDPACLFEVLEFDSIPASLRERMALARFRLEKESPGAVGMECVIQTLGQEEGRTLLLTQAADRAWLGMLQKACRDAGLFPGVIDAAVGHVFNRFHDFLSTSAMGGVLLVINQDSWAILFFDEACRPRFLRSRWRDTNSTSASEHEAIAREVERLVRAYALSAPQRKIGAIYVHGEEQDRALLADQLDARMHAPCVRMDDAAGWDSKPEIALKSFSSSAIAAALPRT